MYGVGNMVGSQPSNTQQAAGFLGQYAGLDDLASFFLSYYPAGIGSVLRVVGPSNSSQPGIEANLDVQYIMSVGGGVSTTFWYTNGTRPYDNEPFLEWMLNVSSLSNAQLPNVISVSYGDNEDTVDYGSVPLRPSCTNLATQRAGITRTPTACLHVQLCLPRICAVLPRV